MKQLSLMNKNHGICIKNLMTESYHVVFVRVDSYLKVKS